MTFHFNGCDLNPSEVRICLSPKRWFHSWHSYWTDPQMQFQVLLWSWVYWGFGPKLGKHSFQLLIGRNCRDSLELRMRSSMASMFAGLPNETGRCCGNIERRLWLWLCRKNRMPFVFNSSNLPLLSPLKCHAHGKSPPSEGSSSRSLESWGVASGIPMVFIQDGWTWDF